MTGIRGLASLWVVLFHIQLNSGRFFGLGWLENVPFLRFGWHAVDLFFMLSGFILMYAHGTDFHTFRTTSLVRFAKLRLTRVYPLNTVVLLLITVLALCNRPFISWMQAMNDPADFSSGAFLRTLLLANRWFLQRKGSWNEPVWSLSLEILGYAAFPLLAYCVSRLATKRQALALIFFSLSGFFYFTYIKHLMFTNMLGQIAVVRMIASFIAGIAVFRLWRLTGDHGDRFPSILTAMAVLGIALACVVPRGEVVLNSLFALLLFALAFQRGPVSYLLSTRPIMFLGKISFPLYLVHGIVFWRLRYFMLGRLTTSSQLNTSLLLLEGILGCVALATVLHFAVERPAHLLGRRWASIGSASHGPIQQSALPAVASQSAT